MAFDILNDDIGSLTGSDAFGGASGFGGFGGESGGKMQIPRDPGMSMPDDPGSFFGTGLPSGYDPVSGNINPSVWSSLGSVLGGGGKSSGGGVWNSILNGVGNFFGGNPADGGLSGLGPYAAVAGLGISQAKSAQKEASKQADQLKALGQPYTDAGKQLLSQYQSGKLRPDQQRVVDASNRAASQLDQAATPLGKIAQQAFAEYNSGKLNPADEQRLNNQVAAQKQQIKQMMANSGITDSSVMAAQLQSIDNQAMIERQDLLDKRFATGNQAYDQWLKTTSEGQQLRIAGQQFASQSFEQMLNNSLGLGAEGMQPAMEAIQLKIQSDAELSQTVTDLLGNLAAAYSYAAAGPRTGGGAGGGGGGGGTNLGQIISGAGNLVGSIGKLFGFKGAGGQAATTAGTVLGGLGGAFNLYEGVKNKNPGQSLFGAGSLAKTALKIPAIAGSSFGTALAASGAMTALPIAAIGFEVADLANKALESKEHKWMSAWTSQTGAKAFAVGKNVSMTKLPDGRVVENKDANKLAELWASGDRAAYDDYYSKVKDQRDPNSKWTLLRKG